MNDYYVTFRSLTSAQQGSFEISKNGIRAALIRTPKILSSAGCGYALRVNPTWIRHVLRILHEANISYEKIMRSDHPGSFREVWL